MRKYSFNEENERDRKQNKVSKVFLVIRSIVFIILVYIFYKHSIVLKIVIVQAVLLISESIMAIRIPSEQHKKIWGRDAYERKVLYNLIFSFFIVAIPMLVCLPQIMTGGTSKYVGELLFGLVVQFGVNFLVLMWLLAVYEAYTKQKEEIGKEEPLSFFKGPKKYLKYITVGIKKIFKEQCKTINNQMNVTRENHKYVIFSKIIICISYLGLVAAAFLGTIEGIDYMILGLLICGMMIGKKKYRIIYYILVCIVLLSYILILAAIEVKVIWVYLRLNILNIVLGLFILPIAVIQIGKNPH